jgi:hypothetical protein
MLEQLLSEVRRQIEQSDPSVKAAAILHLARVLTVFDQAEAERVLERGITLAFENSHPCRRRAPVPVRHSRSSGFAPNAPFASCPFLPTPGTGERKGLFSTCSATAMLKTLFRISVNHRRGNDIHSGPRRRRSAVPGIMRKCGGTSCAGRSAPGSANRRPTRTDSTCCSPCGGECFPPKRRLRPFERSSNRLLKSRTG